MGGFCFTKLLLLHVFLCGFFTFFPTVSISVDILTSTQSLNINQTLISAKRIFELGFFPSGESRYYFGIWYKSIHVQTVVWVANRDTPLEDSKGFLKIGDRGNIQILNLSGNPIWSSNQTTAKNPVLQILDTGNLIIREANENNPTNSLWQSFDYPTDTILPGMKLEYNFDTGTEKHITSWSNSKDPSSGDFSFKLDFHGLPEIFLWNQQSRKYRSGSWNGDRFSGVPEMQPDTDSIKFIFHEDEHQVYYTFAILGNQSLLSRLTVTSGGYLQRMTWIEDSQVWTTFWYAPKDQCDNYRECGPYGICDTNASPVCKCMRGFRAKNQQAWDLRDGSDGCVRNTELDCGSDKFLRVQNLKLPETTSVFVNRSMNLVECEGLCHKNCSCTAYANIEITNGGTGCVMWSDELMDMRAYAEGGQDLYVRLAASDLGKYVSFPLSFVSLVSIELIMFWIWLSISRSYINLLFHFGKRLKF